MRCELQFNPEQANRLDCIYSMMPKTYSFFKSSSSLSFHHLPLYHHHNDNLAQASLTPPLVGMGERAKASPRGHQRAEDIAGLLFCTILKSNKPATKAMTTTRLLGTATTRGRSVSTGDHQLISSSPPGLCDQAPFIRSGFSLFAMLLPVWLLLPLPCRCYWCYDHQVIVSLLEESQPSRVRAALSRDGVEVR